MTNVEQISAWATILISRFLGSKREIRHRNNQYPGLFLKELRKYEVTEYVAITIHSRTERNAQREAKEPWSKRKNKTRELVMIIGEVSSFTSMIGAGELAKIS